MTAGAGWGRRRLTGGWALPLGVVAGFSAAAWFGVLSRSVFLDLLVWWPAWLLLLILAILVRGRRFRRVRLSGLVPLLALAITIVFLVGHLSGWPVMASAEVGLIGPEAAQYDNAALSARISGDLEVGRSDSGFLYDVRSLRWGGEIPIADANERVQGSAVGVTLRPIAEPTPYLFSGWELGLAPGKPWSLTLEGSVQADLSQLDVVELQVGGSGWVALGSAAQGSSVTVRGTFELVVPAGAPVVVLGDASVPEGWTSTPEGWASPVAGDGWVVSVSPEAALRVTDQ